jgi:hypothetical protein
MDASLPSNSSDNLLRESNTAAVAAWLTVALALLLVLIKDSADRRSGPSFVVVEDPAQPFVADDGGTRVNHFTGFLD